MDLAQYARYLRKLYSLLQSSIALGDMTYMWNLRTGHNSLIVDNIDLIFADSLCNWNSGEKEFERIMKMIKAVSYLKFSQYLQVKDNVLSNFVVKTTCLRYCLIYFEADFLSHIILSVVCACCPII